MSQTKMVAVLNSFSAVLLYTNLNITISSKYVPKKRAADLFGVDDPLRSASVLGYKVRIHT